jgi:hypothetical protein
MVAGVGVIGVNAAVDIANAQQDRTRTPWEGVKEAGRNLMRGAVGLPSAAIGAGIMALGERTDSDFLREWAGGIGDTLAARSWGPGQETESETRDRIRKEQPAYRRQKAIMDAMKDQGLTPDQAAQYSLRYSQMGVLDPEQQAKMAARDFQLEQQTGLQTGQLAGAGIGITQQMGWVPGAAQGMDQQFYEMMQGYAADRPAQFQALSAGLTTAAGLLGQWPARLGMGQEWTAEATSRIGEMLAGGMNQWDASKEIQRMTLSTPYAFSRQMEAQGDPGLALVDELGRPANYQEQRAVTLAQRDWGRRRTEFGLAQTSEQLGMQRQWMQQGWGIQDTMTDIRNRYRVEDADMGILGLQNRIQSAREAMDRSQRTNEMAQQQFQWRREDIEVAGVRAGQQWEWQQQDFAENRQQFSTQLGWQMEDFEEGIRFSSGRQRRRLIEQRERAVVRAGWQRRDMNQAESRAEIQYGWGEEDRDKQLERLEEEFSMREEFMEQDNAAQQRNLEYMEKQLEMAQARREELTGQIMPAEEAQRLLQREQQEQGLAWREERLAMDQAYFEEIQPLQEALNAKTDEMNEAWTVWNLLMNEGVPAAAEAFNKAFGPDSEAYLAIQKWMEALESFENLGEGGNALGAAVDQRISEFMEQQFPTYSLR